LTQLEFPEYSVFEDGGADFSEGDWTAVVDMLFLYGLRLPGDVEAAALIDLWKTLRFDYGQGVRLATDGREAEVPSLCPQLSPDERAYVCAVGRQDRELAQVLARRLFSGRQLSLFLTPSA
jgi:hypothetical protein